MAPDRPLVAVVPEQEAARSSKKRLKRLTSGVTLEPTAAQRRERKRLCRSIYDKKIQVVSPRRSMFGESSEPTVVPLDLLREITGGFSEERKLGSGSYGEVYLGVHQDGQKIAVKKIYDMPGVDDKQFQNEFKNLTRLRHKNIVQLVGYCHDIQEIQVKYEGKLVLAEKIHRALCLEYMPNGSLEKYISDECDKYDWHTGYGIIKGICQGLKYLHTELKPPIYHLDLKPANVLLDENMVPRIADFGISRLFGDERTRATKSTLGTQGYLPPEYIRSNLISSKFDIFSLGVVIIKIMSGRAGYYKIADMSPQEFTNLVQENWTNRLHETSNLMKAHSEQVKICIEIGLRCVDDDRQRRPSIQDIVNRLNETETECTYAARKDRWLIYQEAIASTLSQYAQNPNDRHSEQIYHGSTFNRDIVAIAHSNYFKENAGPREASLHDDSQFYRNGNQEYSAYGIQNPKKPLIPTSICSDHALSDAKNWVANMGKAKKLQSIGWLPNGILHLNSDAGPSVQATTWQYPNEMAAQHEFGDRRPLNGFSRATVLSNNDAGPSNQETLPFSQPTYGQTMHQGTPYYLSEGNFINDQGQGSFSAEPTIPSHILVPVPEDDLITDASLTGQQNGYLSLTTDAPGTSYPVEGGVSAEDDFVSQFLSSSYSDYTLPNILLSSYSDFTLPNIEVLPPVLSGQWRI